MKKTTKKIISSILIILLALAMIASVILPAFAAEPDTATAPGSRNASAASDPLTEFLQKLLEFSPLHIIITIAVMTIVFLTSYILTRNAAFIIYRHKAKKMMAEYNDYVQLTGLDPKLILAYFTKFADSSYQSKTIHRHFLEELYSLFLQKKSEELAAMDECGDKDKTHLSIRAEVYRNLLEKNYPYSDFLNLQPLDVDAARLL